MTEDLNLPMDSTILDYVSATDANIIDEFIRNIYAGNKPEYALLFYGNGGNGKTTVTNAILEAFEVKADTNILIHHDDVEDIDFLVDVHNELSNNNHEAYILSTNVELNIHANLRVKQVVFPNHF